MVANEYDNSYLFTFTFYISENLDKAKEKKNENSQMNLQKPTEPIGILNAVYDKKNTFNIFF